VCDFLTPAAARELIAEVDKNKDGKIAFDEWVAMLKDLTERIPEGAVDENGKPIRTKTTRKGSVITNR
jgi:hypothetical protein